MSARVAVVGGGILGLTTALLSARSGHEVTVFERAPEVFSGASLNNEGKVHLGLVYALSGAPTHDLMVRGALRFASVIEHALEQSVDWASLSTNPFDYLVMPDSLLGIDDLAAAYRRGNERYRSQSGGGARYLGETLPALADERAHVDSGTGLPAFHTRERAVDPSRLGALLADAVRRHPAIAVRTSTEVTGVHMHGAAIRVDHSGDDSGDTFAALVNCAWEGRQALQHPSHRSMLNYRVKAAVRIPLSPHSAFDRVATLVLGAFGDVVRHKDYIYASWYPDGRVANEQAFAPSSRSLDRLAHLTDAADIADRQIVRLHDLGLLPDDIGERHTLGGFILARGGEDIDAPTSGLHHRAEFAISAEGRMLTPQNFKLTTAPLAAELAVEHLDGLLA